MSSYEETRNYHYSADLMFEYCVAVFKEINANIEKCDPDLGDLQAKMGSVLDNVSRLEVGIKPLTKNETEIYILAYPLNLLGFEAPLSTKGPAKKKVAIFLSKLDRKIERTIELQEMIKNGILCPRCGRPVEQGAKFCQYDGTPIRKICPACSHSNAPGAQFCANCGANFSQSSTSEIGEVDPTLKKAQSVKLSSDDISVLEDKVEYLIAKLYDKHPKDYLIDEEDTDKIINLLEEDIISLRRQISTPTIYIGISDLKRDTDYIEILTDKLRKLATEIKEKRSQLEKLEKVVNQ